MITTELLSIDFESEDFEADIQNSFGLPHFSFLLRSSTGRKLYLLDAILKTNENEIDIVPQPISTSSGSIRIPLGHGSKPNFKIYFRVYAVQDVPKIRAFIIDDTNEKIVKASPAGTKPKSLKKKGLWRGSL